MERFLTNSELRKVLAREILWISPWALDSYPSDFLKLFPYALGEEERAPDHISVYFNYVVMSFLIRNQSQNYKIYWRNDAN